MENKKQTHEIRVKVTEEQFKVIGRKAEASGMSNTGFLRYLGLNTTLKVEVEK